MSTIFSPSACSWKPSNPWGKCFSHSKRKKRNRKRWTSSRDCSQRRSISPPQWELLVAHIHLFTFAFFKEVSCLSVISKFLCNFSQGTPLSKRASWLICMATFFSVKWRCSTRQAFFWEVLIARRESDWERSIQFALIMRQLDRDTTAITLRGI